MVKLHVLREIQLLLVRWHAYVQRGVVAVLSSRLAKFAICRRLRARGRPLPLSLFVRIVCFDLIYPTVSIK